MTGILWWIRQILLTVIGCFFVVFGVHILVAAYDLNDPASFVLTFFASNLIILISAALVAGFVSRMCIAYRNAKKDPTR